LKSWQKNSWNTLSVISDKQYHKFYLNGKSIGNKYWQVPMFENGNVGLFAHGPVSFQKLVLTTQSTVTLNLLKCVTPDILKQTLQKILNISSYQIGNINIQCPQKKRVLNSAPITATFSLYGNSISSSISLVSELTGKALSSHISITSNFIDLLEPSISSVNPPVSALFPIQNVPITLSLAAIIGIAAAGGSVVIAGIITAIVLLSKKSSVKVKSPENKTEGFDVVTEKEVEPNKIEKIGGLDLDPFKPKAGHTSITKRNLYQS